MPAGELDAIPARTKQLAAAALAKQRDGRRPNKTESSALRRVERARDEQARAEAYNSVSKRDWRRWSGRQHKQLDDHAATYGCPIDGDTIALPRVVRWLHDFLAEHAHILAAARRGKHEDGDPKHRLAEWKARREELRYYVELGLWVPRSQVHGALQRLAGILRQAGDALQREYPGGETILNDALDDFEAALPRLVGDSQADAETATAGGDSSGDRGGRQRSTNTTGKRKSHGKRRR